MSKDKIIAQVRARHIAGAQRYAAGDKSDPFAFNRAMTHIESGICAPRQDGKDGGYDADEASEEAITMLGETYIKTVYRNMARP